MNNAKELESQVDGVLAGVDAAKKYLPRDIWRKGVNDTSIGGATMAEAKTYLQQ